MRGKSSRSFRPKTTSSASTDLRVADMEQEFLDKIEEEKLKASREKLSTDAAAE
jgi:hypothetical protein